MGSPGTSPFRMPGESGGLFAGATLAPPSNAPEAHSRRHPHVGVYLENDFGAFEATEVFDWQSIHLGIDGAESVAVIQGGLDQRKLSSAGSIGDQHLTHLLELLSPDRRVRIAQVTEPNGQYVYFQGFPIKTRTSWSERHQTVSCTCVSEGQELLRHHPEAQITGKRMRWNPHLEWNASAPDDRLVMSELPVFNAGNRGNRGATSFPFMVRGATLNSHLFVEDAADGELWTSVQAITYVLVHYVERAMADATISVTGFQFLADTAGILAGEAGSEGASSLWSRLTAAVPAISIASMSAEEALLTLCKAAGLHYELALDTSNGVAPYYFVRIFAALRDAEDPRPTTDAMGVPTVRDIPREAPFTPEGGRSVETITKANRAASADLTVDHNLINAPIYLGGAKDYEVTLLLRPGWTPHVYLDDLEGDDHKRLAVKFWEDQFTDEFLEEEDPPSRMPTSIYHGSHPEHWKVADVGRLWIFPDDPRYVTFDSGEIGSVYARKSGPWTVAMYSPYGPIVETDLVLTSPALGGGVADARDWVPRRRDVLDSIGRLLHGSDRSPIVRINFVASDPATALADSHWVTYAGRSKILDHGLGVRLIEHNLRNSSVFLADPKDAENSMNMLDAYIGLTEDADGKAVFGAPHFFVSLTCTIRGDERLERRFNPPTGLRRRRAKVVDLGFDRFLFRDRRRGNSHLNAQPLDDDLTYEGRDDDNLLYNTARRQAELNAAPSVAGTFEVPWMDTSYRVGDAVSGCAGLGIGFERYPEIVEIEYAKDARAGYRTTLKLSDLRDAPEADHA